MQDRRISRHEMWMRIAEVATMRSTCFRANVGAVIVRENAILSIGYNGPSSGEPHCTGQYCAPNNVCTRAVHAEINAINRARDILKNSLGRCTLYCTVSPCPECAQRIFNEYVPRVFYKEKYRDPAGVDFLVKQKIEVYRMTPSGYCISELTGNLVDPRDIR